MSWAALSVLLGGGLLWLGGEQFVVGSARLAERTRIPPIVIGMAVAGFGTSTPELVVSLLAQVRGESEIALGNVVGSNVANVFLVLPLAALVAPWAARAAILRREIVAGVVAAALLVALSAGGRIDRAGSLLLLASFTVVMAWLLVSSLRTPGRSHLEHELVELVGPAPETGRAGREVVRVVLGLLVVVASADRLVWGAAEIARGLGIGEAVIGLTLVAFGTSLPEAVTATVAARRNEPDLVLGNVLGSNIFNALLITGSAGLAGPLTITGTERVVGLAGVMAAALAVGMFAIPRYRLTRRQAPVGLACYAGFVWVLYALT